MEMKKRYQVILKDGDNYKKLFSTIKKAISEVGTKNILRIKETYVSANEKKLNKND